MDIESGAVEKEQFGGPNPAFPDLTSVRKKNFMTRSPLFFSAAGSRSRPSADEWLVMVEDPEYRALVQSKRRFLLNCWLLAVSSYFALSVGVAWFPVWFATPVFGETNIGLLLALVEVLLVLMVAALYVRRASRDFDPRAEALAKRFSAARRN